MNEEETVKFVDSLDQSAFDALKRAVDNRYQRDLMRLELNAEEEASLRANRKLDAVMSVRHRLRITLPMAKSLVDGWLLRK